MRTYTQLTQIQRYQIYALKKIDQNQTEIASVIGVHKSTISRELRRNCGRRGYRPKQAHCLAVNKQKKSTNRIFPETWMLIEAKVRLDWSPEQISGWLNRDHGVRVSHEIVDQRGRLGIGKFSLLLVNASVRQF